MSQEYFFIVVVEFRSSNNPRNSFPPNIYIHCNPCYVSRHSRGYSNFSIQIVHTGVLQGCGLSPLLFFLYTNNCTHKDSAFQLLKFETAHHPRWQVCISTGGGAPSALLQSEKPGTKQIDIDSRQWILGLSTNTPHNILQMYQENLYRPLSPRTQSN